MPLPQHINHVHFVGIGGYGMSALALILLQKGYRVSGSDLKESPLTEKLAQSGAAVAVGHDRRNLGSAQLVVYSTAVPSNNPELLAAAESGLPLWHRSELLAVLLNNAYGIAIAGAHGKTTTTAMVALLLEAGGLDPTALIGGVMPAYGSNARLGQSRYLVAEADESDRSFTRYFPRLALVTGMEADHLEHYNNDYSRLQEAYGIFLSNLHPAGAAVLCAADQGLCELGQNLDRQVLYYGLKGHLTPRAEEESGPVSWEQPLPGLPINHVEPDYYAANISLMQRGSSFDFYRGPDLLASTVRLQIPGLHNVGNAAGALALAERLGLEPAACAAALKAFTGVGRRFEVIGTVGGVTVIDDYAHHPTEVRATLEAARPGCKRLICVFQPHRYTRTAWFLDEFSRAFQDADLLLLNSVYSAGEVPIPGATSEVLADQIREHSNIPVFYSDHLYMLEEQALAIARPGDLIITMGAGDITTLAPCIVKRLRQKGEGKNKHE